TFSVSKIHVCRRHFTESPILLQYRPAHLRKYYQSRRRKRDAKVKSSTHCDIQPGQRIQRPQAATANADSGRITVTTQDYRYTGYNNFLILVMLLAWMAFNECKLVYGQNASPASVSATADIQDSASSLESEGNFQSGKVMTRGPIHEAFATPIIY